MIEVPIAREGLGPHRNRRPSQVTSGPFRFTNLRDAVHFAKLPIDSLSKVSTVRKLQDRSVAGPVR